MVLGNRAGSGGIRRNPMTRVVFLGDGGVEMDRLASAVTRIDPDLQIRAPADGRLDHRRANGADVVLIAAGVHHIADLGTRVSEASVAGLPVVALLPRTELFDIDPTEGVIEFCFPPFAPEEVALRLRTAVARSGHEGVSRQIKAGELTIDEDRYEVRVSGRKVDLTYKEYELLKVLAANSGRVFSREALLRTVWEYDYFGGTRTVDVHVRRLRAKINDVNHRFIETVWNVGYRFRATDSVDE